MRADPHSCAFQLICAVLKVPAKTLVKLHNKFEALKDPCANQHVQGDGSRAGSPRASVHILGSFHLLRAWRHMSKVRFANVCGLQRQVLLQHPGR